MADFSTHPAAELFPLLDGPEFDALVDDIREHGQREPIVVHDGMILDGRNRYRACKAIGIEPVVKLWSESSTIEAFVVSMNLHRRHLNESQRAMIAARIYRLPNSVTGQKRLPTGKFGGSDGITQKDAGNLLNVGKTAVVDAVRVVDEAAPEEVAAVERGQVSVSKIADQIRAGQKPKDRKQERDAPLSKRGKNPARLKTQRINAAVWKDLRAALEGLTGLPRPADVVAIARAHDKTGLVDNRLSRSLKWLEEFEHEWSSRETSV